MRAALIGTAIAAVVGAWPIGLRINTTASMPQGLWLLRKPDAITRGQIVTACPPRSSAVEQAAVRGWIGQGSCPSGLEPLLKVLAAVPGDTVTVSSDGIAINSVPYANTQALAADSQGRALASVSPGVYPVAPGTVWLLSGYDNRSYDSRYFGPVPMEDITAHALPVVTR